MRADELRTAVTRIMTILSSADVRARLDRFRAATGGDRTVAAARLGQSGALIMERFGQLSELERRVAERLHLDSLADPDYWDKVILATDGQTGNKAELVRLASRVMFASNNLPGLLALLEQTENAPADQPALAASEAPLIIRLVEGGERASDPDRIARAIDGVDMLYSACASLAQGARAAFRLEKIDGTVTRDLHFAGDKDAIAAVVAVLDSVRTALGELNSSAQPDVEEAIRSLPVFEELESLSDQGAVSPSDIKDIAETLYQGAMLVVESGVKRLAADDARAASTTAAMPRAESTPPAQIPATPAADVGDAAVADNPDDDPRSEAEEHYEHYLRERAALQQTDDPLSGQSAVQLHADGDARPGSEESDASAPAPTRGAVSGLLKSLSRKPDKS